MSDKGKIIADFTSFSKEDFEKLNEMLGKPKDEHKDDSPAPKAPKDQPKDEVSELKAELQKAKNDLAAKDEQIKNLQKNPSPEDKTNDNPADGQAAFTAFDLAESLKDL